MRLFSPVVPFRCCDGAHRFLKQQAGRLSTRRVAMHGPIGDSGPMAFFDCPGGHRVGPETRVFKHGPDFSDCYFPPKSSVSKSPTVTAGKWFPKTDRLSARGAQAACGFK
jgi:hypothetical protein